MKRKARKWVEYCADNEWGNREMERIALDRLRADTSLDCVEVIEHAGWHLTFTRSQLIVGTANDTAILSREARTWRDQFTDIDIVGQTRRADDGAHRETKFANYFPTIHQAREVA